MSISLSVGLLLLRLVVGLTMAGHGAQKLFGWFGGPGFNGVVGMQQSLGLKPAQVWAVLVILGELGAGLSVAFGLLTFIGAAAIFGDMLMAIIKVHWKNGFWSAKGGIEFTLLLLVASVALGFTGPGSYSLDALFGITLSSTLLPFIIVAVVALIVDIIGLIISRPAPATVAKEA